MKIKNLMFSGFTAALFASVCGAADAATVSLISKDYADANLQAKLEAGDNITIENGTISATGLVGTETLTTSVNELKELINAKAAQSDMTTAQADIDAVEAAIELLKTGKADAQTVTDLQNAIDALGDTYATDEEVSAAIAAVEEKIPTVPTNVSAFTNDAGYLVSGDLADYAKSADVETTYATKESVANTYATKEFVGTLPEGATATNIIGYVQEKTAGIATNENLAELTGRVAANEAAIEKKANSETVATDIAAALAEAKKYADDNDADTIYDDTALVGRVKTLEDAGYQNAAQVESAITTATSTLATKSELNAVSTSLSEYKTSNDGAVALKANAADVYTKGEVDAAIGAIEEYDDTALAGRVTVNEGAISTNATNIATNAGNITANATAIEALQGAGYVVGTKSAGSYLVNFDAQGNASYAAVEILDDKGAPIDLTTNAVK